MATKKSSGNGTGAAAALETIGSPSNAAAAMVLMSEPYVAEFTIEGTTAILLHRWNVDAVEEKANAQKGSKQKKTDDVESYVYRDKDGFIGLPGTYIAGSIVNAAKYLQDPRSPRKSKMDIYRAGVVPLDDLASMGSRQWDYLDRRRVVVQRSGITRQRPAFNPGWRATFHVQVLLPEYIPSQELLEVIGRAGKLVGIADMRPTFGRFTVVNFQVMKD